MITKNGYVSGGTNKNIKSIKTRLCAIDNMGSFDLLFYLYVYFFFKEKRASYNVLQVQKLMLDLLKLKQQFGKIM